MRKFVNFFLGPGRASQTQNAKHKRAKLYNFGAIYRCRFLLLFYSWAHKNNTNENNKNTNWKENKTLFVSSRPGLGAEGWGLTAEGVGRCWTWTFPMFFAFCPFICLCVRVANKNKYIILHAAKTRARRCTNLIQIQLKKWQNNVRAGRAPLRVDRVVGWLGAWVDGRLSPQSFSVLRAVRDDHKKAGKRRRRHRPPICCTHRPTLTSWQLKVLLLLLLLL